MHRVVIDRVDSRPRRMMSRDLRPVRRMNVSEIGTQDLFVAENVSRDGLTAVCDDEPIVVLLGFEWALFRGNKARHGRDCDPH